MAAKKVRYIGKHAPAFVEHAVHGRLTFPAGEAVSVPAELADSLALQVDKWELVTAAKSKAKADEATTDPEEG